MTILLDCGYDDSPHEFPDDWIFGGPNNCHPGADSRFLPSTYTYLSSALMEVHVTQTPLCLEQALDEFTQVASWGLKPVYIQVKAPGERPHVLDVQYNERTDTIHPLG